MKKRMRRSRACFAVVMIALCIALVGFAGCSSNDTKSNEGKAEASMFSAPALQPADHGERFKQGGATLCYTCHGASDAGNPQDNSARAIPDDHYQNGSSDSQELNADRNQCITCHPAYSS